ncbi:Serine palmitoyltransferase 2 [Armadillidium nasatum]|uniref:serine C-palmitoyltransferase n=1 Tax=Armadillidium nasatum TaxID=96803 RepID=A0A5N5SPI2_9CRUS|nr:Serine palmitoyltransferase 2 [Armadillidium nasatum]
MDIFYLNNSRQHNIYVMFRSIPFSFFIYLYCDCYIGNLVKYKTHEEKITRPIEKFSNAKTKKRVSTVEDDCPMITAFFTFLSFGVLLLVGYIKEFFYPPSTKEKNREGYVPLYIGFESFYTRNVYRRIQHCWGAPICSVPGSRIEVIERHSVDHGWSLQPTGRKMNCLNVGSYNYLGFAENVGPCYETSAETTKTLGMMTSSSRLELGSMRILEELERLMSEFLGVDDTITFGMGFATNVLNIPSLLGPGCLVLSDEFNHASIILGIKVSGATVKVFKHNDTNDLERLLRHHIIHGHPRTRRAWRKILIVAEGIYSMEGTICDLPRLIELKKKYKAYLYVDEAHSIGALGPNGGGVVDYYGADPKDVDILMGTFTKSFGAAGGYIAGNKDLINHLRIRSDAQSYAASMPPPVAQQILTSLTILMGRDGTTDGQKRIEQLARNVHYFRQRLKQLGFIVFGDDDSPVVPLLLFMIPKLTHFVTMFLIIFCVEFSVFIKELWDRGVASVGVGFPATKLNGARMHFEGCG